MRSVVLEGERDGLSGDNIAVGLAETAVVDNGVVHVSEQDDRSYRHITLPNQMQVSTN